MSETLPHEMTGPVAAVRRFSRFYTRQLGLLDEGLLNSAFSLTEARVLYELANQPTLTATELSRDLGIDPGYLSRVLKEFERQGLITRAPSPGDGRLALLQLTDLGRAAFEPLDKASRHQILAMIRHLTPAEAARLVQAMQTIEHLMGESASSQDRIILRQHQGRRYRLDRPSAGRAVCTGVWVGRNLRNPGRRNPGWDRQDLRSGPGAKLDRGTGRSGDRFSVCGARIGDSGETPAVVCRTGRTWSGSRPASCGRLHRFCSRTRLSDAVAMDERRSPAGPPYLPSRRIRLRRSGAAPLLRPGPDRRDMGVDVVSRAVHGVSVNTAS